MINIVIVEDLPLVLEGIKVMLAQDNDFCILRTFSNGNDLLQQLKYFEDDIDILIVDIEMPEISGIELTKQVLKQNSGIKIIALSMYDEQEYYNEMISAGAKGFVLKQKHYKELRGAILKVYNGEFYFSPDVLMNVIGKLKEGDDDSIQLKLSEREKQLIQLISEGFINKEIADKMNTSVRSIESLKSRLLSKTDTRNNASLLMWGIKNGIVIIN